MVDVHTHILPNMDDGASSYDEAMDMLNLMINNGVDTVVATPHFNFEANNQPEFVLKRTEEIDILKRLVKEAGLEIAILSGAELMFTTNLNQYNLEDFTIEGTDYLLIELSTKRNEPSLEHVLTSIISSGFIPILAHIERYQYLIDDSQRLVDLINLGVIMQINASSLDSLKKFSKSKTLIEKNLVHIIGSDAHDMSRRKPNLCKRNIGLYFVDNQSRIINNQLIEIKRPRKMVNWFGRYI